MSYSTHLEELIDKHIRQEKNFVKKKMFGGLGYLFNGNMCVGIWKEFLVLRTSKEEAELLLKEPGMLPFDITGRAMDGWIMVDPSRYTDDNSLAYFLSISRNFVAGLPPR